MTGRTLARRGPALAAAGALVAAVAIGCGPASRLEQLTVHNTNADPVTFAVAAQPGHDIFTVPACGTAEFVWPGDGTGWRLSSGAKPAPDATASITFTAGPEELPVHFIEVISGPNHYECTGTVAESLPPCVLSTSAVPSG